MFQTVVPVHNSVIQAAVCTVNCQEVTSICACMGYDAV